MAASVSRQDLPSSDVPRGAPARARESVGKNQERRKPSHELIREMAVQLQQLPLELVFLCEKKVAILLDISEYKLQRDRSKGGGIPFVVMGNRTIRYRLSDVLEWVGGSNRRASTSDAGTNLVRR